MQIKRLSISLGTLHSFVHKPDNFADVYLSGVRLVTCLFKYTEEVLTAFVNLEVSFQPFAPQRHYGGDRNDRLRWRSTCLRRPSLVRFRILRFSFNYLLSGNYPKPAARHLVLFIVCVAGRPSPVTDAVWLYVLVTHFYPQQRGVLRQNTPPPSSSYTSNANKTLFPLMNTSCKTESKYVEEVSWYLPL